MAYNPADLRLPRWLLALLAIWVRIPLPFWPGWRISMSRPGVLFFLILSGVWAAALYSGNNLLYLCGSVLLVLALTSVVESIYLLRSISRLSLPFPECAEVGQSLLVRHAIAMPHRFSAMVELWRVGETGAIRFDLRLEQGRLQLTGHLPALSRGIYRYPQMRLATSSPLGLWRLEWRKEASFLWEMMVLPEPEAWSPRALCLTGENHGRAASSGDELHGLRPYFRGDSVSRVHWRKSLTDQWSVKLFSTEEEDAVVIELLRIDLRSEPGKGFEKLLARTLFWIENNYRHASKIVIGQQHFDLSKSEEKYQALRALATATPEALPPSGRGGLVLSSM